jgi:hypothetical protein
MRVLRVACAHHAAATPGASVTVNCVRFFSFLWITGIDRCRRIILAQNFIFADIKPDALAAFAAIDLDAHELDRLHVIPAFGAAHRAGAFLHGPTLPQKGQFHATGPLVEKSPRDRL